MVALVCPWLLRAAVQSSMLDLEAVGTFPIDFSSAIAPVMPSHQKRPDEGMDSNLSILGLTVGSDYLEKKLEFS